jgi:glycosyltransferase involved in cell wall biosynthesis
MASTSSGPAPVLFAHHGRDWIRGSERCLLDLIERLDRTRFRPILWCDAPILAEAARAAGAEVHQSRTTAEAGTTLPLDRAMVRTAVDLVRRHGIRLIHANDINPLPALVVTARSQRVPLVSHLHLIPAEAERRWMLLHQVTLAVGVSRASIAGLLADGMPANRTAVIYNGIDGERLARGSAAGLRAERGIAPEAFVATAVASLIERKGIDTVLRAVAELAARGRDVHLLLCGDGPDEASIRELAETLAISHRVHFLGVREDVGPILRDATDVLVSAARLEAFPLNLLEAGECGLPSVVSDIAPHLEAVIDGVTGRIVATDDPSAFAAALEEFAADPAVRRRMGEAARARVRAEFSFERWLTTFEDTYSALLRRPAGELGWVRGSTWPSVYSGWVRSSVGRRLARFAGSRRR